MPLRIDPALGSALGGAIANGLIALALAWRYPSVLLDEPEHVGAQPPAAFSASARVALSAVGGAIVSLGAAIALGASPEAFRYAALGSTLLHLLVVEGATWLLPRPVVLCGVFIALSFAAARGGSAVADALLGGLAGFVAMAVLRAALSRIWRRETVGPGAILASAMVGAFVGWPAALLVAVTAGVATGPLFLAGHLIGRKAVPASVGLTLGALVAISVAMR